MNSMIQGRQQSANEVFEQMRAQAYRGNNMTMQQEKDLRNTCNTVYTKAANFLKAQHLLNGNQDLNGFDSIVSCEGFNTSANVAALGEEQINRLVMESGISREQQPAAADAVMCLLAKLQASRGSSANFRTQHFGQVGRDASMESSLQNTMTTVYSPSLKESVSYAGIPSNEAFGADVDKVLPDITGSLAITLLQFHRGLLDRIMPHRVSASPYIKYKVPYAEVYDMLKSNDAESKVRNHGDHIIPFISLYNDPRAVSNTLQTIVPLKSNDTEDLLVADGVVKFNTNVNLFDLSVLPNQIGKTHYNFTDLVSENVILDSVLIKLTKGSVEEIISIDTKFINSARLQMMVNSDDSANRVANLVLTEKLGKNTKTVNGTESTILSACTDSDFIRASIQVTSFINLKTADARAIGAVSAEAYNAAGGLVSEEVTAILDGATISLVGYSLDAKYSEENLRKSNLAIRYHERTFDFEISNGRNILVDYSFNEQLPDFLMSLVTEATSLGQDHRGIDVIVKQLMYVYDRTQEENANPDFRSKLDKIGFQYVASQLVQPVVYISSIDLAQVDYLKSGEYLGDVRGYVEAELLNLVSLYYQNSFYKHQLKPGEKPVFKVFTSSVILENLLSVPHYHDHLNTEMPEDGSTVEYRRVLPNGTILDCVTCTYNYIRDKIVMIPFRPDAPEDVLNFGHNWDFGTFVANYNPQYDNSVNKRVFANSRTMVVPTNPSGIYLDVKNISRVIDMFQVTNPLSNGSTLPQPSDMVAND